MNIQSPSYLLTEVLRSRPNNALPLSQWNLSDYICHGKVVWFILMWSPCNAYITLFTLLIES